MPIATARRNSTSSNGAAPVLCIISMPALNAGLLAPPTPWVLPPASRLKSLKAGWMISTSPESSAASLPVASGSYLARLSAGHAVQVRRLTLVR